MDTKRDSPGSIFCGRLFRAGKSLATISRGAGSNRCRNGALLTLRRLIGGRILRAGTAGVLVLILARRAIEVCAVPRNNKSAPPRQMLLM